MAPPPFVHPSLQVAAARGSTRAGDGSGGGGGDDLRVSNDMMAPEHQAYWQEQLDRVVKPAARALKDFLDMTHPVGAPALRC